MAADTFSSALGIVQSSGYSIVFLLMVLEGPIVTAAAAFASSFGVFNVYSILVLSILANFIGDSIYYFIGRTGRHIIIDQYFKNIHKVALKKKIEHALHTHTMKALAIVKLIPPLPTPGLIIAGISKIPMRKFLLYSLWINLAYSLVFTLTGFYAGFAFNMIYQYVKRIEIMALIVLIVALLFWLASKMRLWGKIKRILLFKLD